MNVPLLTKKSSTATPWCTAPFTSVVVDPNKRVRPCCAFAGSLGNLERDSLTEILNGPEWNAVKTQISHGETPAGCVNCSEREKLTGWSVRTQQYDPQKTSTDRWGRGITQLEINSSNICNLACTHCNAEFSSRWVQLREKHGTEVGYHHVGPTRLLQIHAPNPDNMVRQLAALDLQHLEIVRFKGGEPMLNHDVPAVLQYLLDRGILPRVSVDFVSNGSLLPEKILELLRQAGRVSMCISVDGTGALQEYIRRGPSEIARIEDFIETLSSLERISFSLSVSVMVYNVFSLDTISEWWNDLGRKYPGKLPALEFGLHVVSPAYLSVDVLQDATRQRLIAKYRGLSNANYSTVIQALGQQFAGVSLHNEFVAYTRDMDRMWSADVLKVIPELEPEMIVLEASASPRKSKWRWGFSRQVEPQRDTLQRGMSLSDSGKYKAALRLYERYLTAASEKTLANKWEILLHRAIVLGKLERWEQSHEEFYGLARLAPQRTLKALQGAENSEHSSVVGALSQSFTNETGFVEAPSFRLLIEGLSYRALNNHAEAAARLDRALELDPNFALAKVAKRQLDTNSL